MVTLRELRHPAPAAEGGALRVLHGWVERVEPGEGRFRLRSRERLVTLRCPAGAEGPFEALRSECVVRAWVRDQAGEEDGEVECVRLEVLSSSQSLPFRPAERERVSAGLRSRFRYLEFRDPEVHRLLRLRHEVQRAVSRYLDDRGFISVETPILATPSGSGANEFRVSSSRNPDVAYALPQSPQVYGHLLVLGGVERYYQWARCFRDEDLRTNRQPEFTQLHVEVAFAGRDELMEMLEGAVTAGMAAADRGVAGPVPRIAYDEAIRRFGCDKPDLRCAPEVERLPYRLLGTREGETLVSVRLPAWVEMAAGSTFALQRIARASRTRFLGYVPKRAGGLGWLKQTMELAELEGAAELAAEPGPSCSMLWAAEPRRLDGLHLELYRWICGAFSPPEGESRLAWVTDFPLFTPGPEGGAALASFGHPFTRPPPPA